MLQSYSHQIVNFFYMNWLNCSKSPPQPGTPETGNHPPKLPQLPLAELPYLVTLYIEWHHLTSEECPRQPWGNDLIWQLSAKATFPQCRGQLCFRCRPLEPICISVFRRSAWCISPDNGPFPMSCVCDRSFPYHLEHAHIRLLSNAMPWLGCVPENAYTGHQINMNFTKRIDGM